MLAVHSGPAVELGVVPFAAPATVAVVAATETNTNRCSTIPLSSLH